MAKDDGGPAYPVYDDKNGCLHLGMSLRAHLAGQAFEALTQAWVMPHNDVEGPALGAIPNVADWNILATAAVEGADVLLANLKG